MSVNLNKRRVIVGCFRRDKKGFSVRKYDNAPDLRFLREITPKRASLSPLALFILDNAPKCIAGKGLPFDHAERVRCFSGWTHAQWELLQAAKQIINTADRGTMDYRVNNMAYKTGHDAMRAVRNLIYCYSLDTDPHFISCWLFDQIEPSDDGTQWLNRQAEKIVQAGTRTVELNNKSFNLY